MENIIVAIITGVVAIIVAAIGVTRRNRTTDAEKEGPPENRRLIDTLNKTVEAQSKQIEILRAIADEQRLQLEAKDEEIHDLTTRVSNLERLTIEQALVIRELEKSRSIRRVRNEGGEAQTHD